jgi:hypothetical protein
MTHSRTGTCEECWVFSDLYLVDAGMFGEKNVCHACYTNHYAPRPILEAPTLLMYTVGDPAIIKDDTGKEAFNIPTPHPVAVGCYDCGALSPNTHGC